MQFTLVNKYTVSRLKCLCNNCLVLNHIRYRFIGLSKLHIHIDNQRVICNLLCVTLFFLVKLHKDYPLYIKPYFNKVAYVIEFMYVINY